MRCKLSLRALTAIVALCFYHVPSRITALNVKLNNEINIYDTLDYDPVYLRNEHSRAKRAVSDGVVKLDFNAFGREFRLRLKRDTHLFTDDIVVESGGKPIAFDKNIMMKGKLADDENSEVLGSILDGKFHGKITTEDEDYYIESSDRYVSSPSKFHSIIYRNSDVRFKRSHPISGCGLNAEIVKKMEEIKHMKTPTDVNENIQRKSRDTTKNTCQLLVQADHTFTENYGNSVERAAAVLSNFVQSVSSMFARADFDGDGLLDSIGFIIRRLKINTTTDASKPNNPFAPSNIGVSQYLDIASQANHNSYCLAVTFANRDFDNGVLGLAWVASKGGAGGICDRNRLYKGQYMSLNSAIVTVLNYGSHVSSAVTEVTLAHELGHNFGSQHDPTAKGDCAPGDPNGNFIMYPRATAGNKPHNKEFSKCSKNYINPIIKSKADSCFETRAAAICGNNIVEEGEACDCGFTQVCTDKCCNAAYESEALQPTGYKPCQLKDGIVCSATAGPCCNPNTCDYYTAMSNISCADATECSQKSYCNGYNFTCPGGDPKPDVQTTCARGVRVCKSGQCTGSICEKYGRKSCTCDAIDDACVVCCNNGTKPCPKATTIPAMQSLTNLVLPPGTPCKNFEGYCDVFGKCRRVNEEGPLNRLTNIFFSAQTYQNLLDWIRKYPWAVVLIGIGVIMAMAIFIKLCSVHTPSNNPKLPKARTLTLRRNSQFYQQEGQIRHHQARPHREQRNDKPTEMHNVMYVDKNQNRRGVPVPRSHEHQPANADNAAYHLNDSRPQEEHLRPQHSGAQNIKSNHPKSRN